MGLFDACRVCGGKPFHDLGCPVLTHVTRTVTLFFGAVTVCLVLWTVMGRSSGNIALGVALTLFFAGYWFLSSRRAKERRS